MKYFSDELLAAANRGDLTSADSVALYAGYMRLLETNDRVQDEKRRVGAILKALLKEGVLEAIEERDPISRQAAIIMADTLWRSSAVSVVQGRELRASRKK